MTFTIEHIEEIKRRLQYLEEHFNIDTSDNMETFEDEDIEELITEMKEIEIYFPDECDNIQYSLNEFWKYTSDLANIEMVDSSTVRDGLIRQTIIDVNEFDYEKYDVNKYKLITDDYIIRIVDNPIFIGLIASKEGICDDNCCITPCSMYSAIEIEYFNSKRLTITEEENIIERFLFFISARIDTSIAIGEFFTFPDDYYEYEDDDEGGKNDEQNKQYQLNINDIPRYTQAMQYYVNALSIKNDEIKFLYFYKIIEYFSPLVSKKKSYELLDQRLDIMSIKGRDHKYLESIFQLTRDYDISLRDKELANTVLCECVDIIELLEYLPKIFTDRHLKRVKSDEYGDLKTEKILDLKKELGIYLYSTRNSIVHAKSNYKLTGNECQEGDLKDLNIFMSKLCHCLIIWNGRQAKEFQV